MKPFKGLVFIAIATLAGCGLISSSPGSVVKEFVADAKKHDVDAMVKLWASKAINEQGQEKIRAYAQNLAEINSSAVAAGKNPQIEKLREAIEGERARVFFIYRASAHDSVGLGFALLKENGKWKLYRQIDIGDEQEAFDTSFAPPKAVNDVSPAQALPRN